ncbi:MAG: hypothetical protein DRJ01_15065, partial [Bacteroidetes bacterium]
SNPITANSQDTFTYELLPSVGDLIISEVCGDGVDGSNSNDNGSMEIYNTTSNTLSLANVQARYYNSNPGAPTQTVDLSGTIAPGGYIIITQNETNFNATYAPITADFSGSSFYFNGGDDGVDIYDTSTRAGILDSFNDNGTGASPWTWNDDNVFERTSTGDGALSGSWTENTIGYGTPGADNENPLPVTLSSFTAQYVSGNLTLHWTTQSETNNSGWNIYRSISDNFDEANKINSELIEGFGTTTIPHNYSYQDLSEYIPGSTYWYWLESKEYDGSNEVYSSISIDIPENNLNPPDLSDVYGLFQNYPNPFNPSTEISFCMDRDVFVTLTVYNLKGRKVNTIFQSNVKAKTINKIIWDGKDEAGNNVSSGIYMYMLKTDNETYLRKMLLSK